MEQYAKENSFLDRALTDTAYLSRIAREYLTCICPQNGAVRAIPGRMTAKLRGKFGLNQLLSGTEQKNRNDHRHHALDAAVIGITDQGMLQAFAKANASARERGLSKLVDTLTPPWPTYREHVERAIKAIVVSHRPNHGYQGAFHEESAWGIGRDGLARREGADEPKEAGALIQVHSTNDARRHGLNDDGSPRAYKGYVGGSNYCIEVFRDEKEKVRGEVVSRFQAYQMVRNLGEKQGVRRLRDPSRTLSNKPLVMRLMRNDCVELVDEGARKAFRLCIISTSGTLGFAELHEANVDARAREKSLPYVFKTPGSLSKASGRRVVISVTGIVRRLA
jgi:CRISPR-associated endonuclease Csn1